MAMLAEDLSEGNVISAQVGGLDAGVAGLNEMSAFESLAERRIVEAAAVGAFDNLQGHGKRIDLDARPDLESSEALAVKVLKNANVQPAWVEAENRIRGRIEKFRETLQGGFHEGRHANASSEVAALNAEIRQYNLRCPPKFQKPLLDLKVERIAVSRST